MTRDAALDELLETETIKKLSFWYSRACDRLDRQLLEQVYWPDGGDDHGVLKDIAKLFADGFGEPSENE